MLDESLEKITSSLDSMCDELAHLCSKLIQIPAENPPGDMSAIISFLVDWLSNWEIVPKIYEREKGRQNVVIHATSQTRNTVLLNGHIDVSPVDSIQSWQFPPYSGEIRDTKKAKLILGNGSSDMKGGLVSIIGAYLSIQKCFPELSKHICLSIVPDEETGGEYGSYWLLEKNFIAGNSCIIPEPSLKSVCFVAETGLVRLRLSVPSIHPSHRELITRALESLRKLECRNFFLPQHFHEVVSKSQVFFSKMFDNQGTTLGNKIGRLGNHILIEEVMDTDDSSIATNSLEIDIHVPLFTSMNQIIAEIYETLKSLLDRSMNLEILYKYEPSYSALSERMYILLSKNVSNIGVRELLPLCTLARSDATYFRQHRIPTYLYGPGNPILAHRPNEWVNFFDVIDVASVIAKTCIDMLEQNLDKRG